MEKAREILVDLRKIIRSLNLESKRFNKEYGITMPQLFTLNFLNEQDNYQALHKDLALALNLNSSTVTGIIDRLENKGLVARVPAKTDRRKMNIVLTSKGQKLLIKTPESLHYKLSKKLELLNAEETLTLTQSIKKLSEILDASELDASPILTLEEPLSDNENIVK